MTLWTFSLLCATHVEAPAEEQSCFCIALEAKILYDGCVERVSVFSGATKITCLSKDRRSQQVIEIDPRHSKVPPGIEGCEVCGPDEKVLPSGNQRGNQKAPACSWRDLQKALDCGDVKE